MRTEQEIEALLRQGWPAATPALDERILTDAFAALDEAAAQRRPHHLAWAAAAVGAAAIVLLAVVIVRHPRGRPAVPGSDPADAALALRGDQGEAVPPSRDSCLVATARPRMMGAREIVLEAPLIYKVRVIDDVSADASTPPVFEAEVLRVFKGDVKAQGTPVLLVRNEDLVEDFEDPRAAARLGGIGRALEPCIARSRPRVGAVCLVPLAPAVHRVDDVGRARLRNPFSPEIRVTLVSKTDVDPEAWAAWSAGNIVDIVERLKLELLNALDDPEADVRWSAICALLFWEGEGPVRTWALWRDKEAFQRILKAAEDPDWRVRYWVAAMIPKEADKQADEVLVRLLFDRVPAVRVPAKRGLRRRGRGDVVEALEALVDREKGDGLRALWPAGSFSGRTPTERYAKHDTARLIRRLRRSHSPDAAHALGTRKGSREAVDALIEAMNDDEHPEARCAAAQSLGLLGGEAATEALAAVGDTEDGRVRLMALRSLARLADPRGIDRLIAMLKDPEPRRAVQAADALGEIGTEKAVVPLLAAAKHERAVVRGFAAIALAALSEGPHAKEIHSTFDRLAKDASPFVRAAATVAKERAESRKRKKQES